MEGVHSDRLLGRSVLNLMMRGASAAFGLAATVLLARSLGVAGFGQYSFVYALVMLLAVPAHAGLPGLVVRETAHGIARGHFGVVQGIWRYSGRLAALLSIAIALLAAAVALAMNGPGLVVDITLLWGLALIPLIAAGNLRAAALQGIGRVVVGQAPEFFVRPTLFLLLLLGAVSSANVALDSGLAMRLQVVASLAALLAATILMWALAPRELKRATPVRASSRLLRSGTLFGLIAGFGVLNEHFGTLILGVLSGPEDAGAYRIAFRIATLGSFGLLAVNSVVAPQIARRFAQKRMRSLQLLVQKSASIAFLFSICATLIIALAGKSVIVPMLGVEYHAALTPTVILLGGQLVNSFAGPVGYLLNMTGHERSTLRAMGYASAANVALALVLVPRFGAVGAASAASLSLVMWNALLVVRAQRILGIQCLAVRLGRYRES